MASQEDMPAIPHRPELRVRTMQSDMDAIMGRGQREDSSAGSVFTSGYPSEEGAGAGEKSSLGNAFRSRIVVPVVFLLVVAGLAFIGYFIVYPLFSEQSASLPGETQEASPAPSVPGSREKAGISHQSFFAAEPAEDINFIFDKSPVTQAAQLQTYGQKLTAFLDNAGITSDFTELSIQRTDGAFFSIQEFLPLINGEILEASFLEEHFEKDFTAFVYKDRNGYWPGYVLRLKGATIPSLLQIEDSPNIVNLFLASPGDPQGAFEERQIDGRSVRARSFSEPGAMFGYAWHDARYLVVTTSEGGLRRAFEHLGR